MTRVLNCASACLTSRRPAPSFKSPPPHITAMINFPSNIELQAKVEQDEDGFKWIFVIFERCCFPIWQPSFLKIKRLSTRVCSSSWFVPVRWACSWAGRGCHNPHLSRGPTLGPTDPGGPTVRVTLQSFPRQNTCWLRVSLSLRVSPGALVQG